jgi:hypothetical protein
MRRAGIIYETYGYLFIANKLLTLPRLQAIINLIENNFNFRKHATAPLPEAAGFLLNL